jgi:hypothetical protein
MAVECSAALPIIATTMMPTKVSVMPNVAHYASIVPTKNSESSATNPVATSRTMIALPRDQYLAFFLQFAWVP